MSSVARAGLDRARQDCARVWGSGGVCVAVAGRLACAAAHRVLMLVKDPVRRLGGGRSCFFFKQSHVESSSQWRDGTVEGWWAGRHSRSGTRCSLEAW